MGVDDLRNLSKDELAERYGDGGLRALSKDELAALLEMQMTLMQNSVDVPVSSPLHSLWTSPLFR